MSCLPVPVRGRLASYITYVSVESVTRWITQMEGTRLKTT